MSEKITVLLVDDHKMVRQGVRAFLQTQADITVVAEADSGETAVTLAAEHAPDVVLMDLVMPGMDGVTATRLVKAQSPRTQIIMLTSYHQDEHIFPAIRAGALSYLLKDIEPAAPGRGGPAGGARRSGAASARGRPGGARASWLAPGKHKPLH
jgi:NarL family two-component system response regulator LiaR